MTDTTTATLVTARYSYSDDRWRVELYAVGDPVADEVLDVESGEETDARALAAEIASERGARLFEWTGEVPTA